MARDKKNIEEDILQRAFAAFRKFAPLDATIETTAQEPVYANRFRPDLMMRVTLPDKELNYCAEIKTSLTLTKAQALLLLLRRAELPCPLLLIARHVNQEMAEELRQNGLEFIDTAGNAYINQPPVYVFIKGNRPPMIAGTLPLKRAFRTAGLG